MALWSERRQTFAEAATAGPDGTFGLSANALYAQVIAQWCDHL